MVLAATMFLPQDAALRRKGRVVEAESRDMVRLMMHLHLDKGNNSVKSADRIGCGLRKVYETERLFIFSLPSFLLA